MMKCRIARCAQPLALAAAAAGALLSASQSPAPAASDLTKVLRGAAIGYAVKQTANPLNSFVNSITVQHKLPAGTSTRVVPILSVGEKGYVGAAQVAGPSAEVNRVQAVWQYEQNFSNNEFRLKVLMPSASLNPLQFSKVQKVGISAVIDISLDGRWKGQTYSRTVGTSEVIRAAAIGAAIKAAANPLNSAINTVTNGQSSNTKVVPVISIGDKAYVGGVQVSGPAASVSRVNLTYQYDGVFDGGKYRVRALVPTDSVSPLRFKRISGIGITALIDTSIADQQRIRERSPQWARSRARYSPMDQALRNRFPELGKPGSGDNGRHLGWYIGVGNQRKDEGNRPGNSHMDDRDRDRDRELERKKENNRSNKPAGRRK